MKKLFVCLCENKDTDQFCRDCTDDERICFHYMDSMIPFYFLALFCVCTDQSVRPDQKPLKLICLNKQNTKDNGFV